MFVFQWKTIHGLCVVALLVLRTCPAVVFRIVASYFLVGWVSAAIHAWCYRRCKDIFYYHAVVRRQGLVEDGQCLFIELKHSIARSSCRRGECKILIPGGRLALVRQQQGKLEARMLTPEECFRIQGWDPEELGAHLL